MKALSVRVKWGFGMAPEKPETVAKREKHVRQVHSIIANGELNQSPWVNTSISETKGLFTRCVKQDQWDWFVVWCRLGMPGLKKLSNVSRSLDKLNRSLKTDNSVSALEHIEALRAVGAERYLGSYLSGEIFFGVGCVYILSTREAPDILKIGFTARNPIDRVKEINSATGVIVPFGVRAAWRVDNPVITERLVHERLSPWRIRQDREFFNIPFRQAFDLINDLLAEVRSGKM